MIGYCSWTATTSTLEMLESAGWRLLVSPWSMRKLKGKPPKWPSGRRARFALDNGAWQYHQKGGLFEELPFLWAYESVGHYADFTVVPDKVGNREVTLAMAAEWFPRLKYGRKLIAVQDGMTPEDIMPYIKQGAGIFVGGTTEWKLSTIPLWGVVSKETGAWLHVGRVNSKKRINLCAENNADSIDGSGPVRFPYHIESLTQALHQT